MLQVNTKIDILQCPNILTRFISIFLKKSNNKSRSLDCWKEVANFKEAVAEEQKKFVAAHQN